MDENNNRNNIRDPYYSSYSFVSTAKRKEPALGVASHNAENRFTFIAVWKTNAQSSSWNTNHTVTNILSLKILELITTRRNVAYVQNIWTTTVVLIVCSLFVVQTKNGTTKCVSEKLQSNEVICWNVHHVQTRIYSSKICFQMAYLYQVYCGSINNLPMNWTSIR